MFNTKEEVMLRVMPVLKIRANEINKQRKSNITPSEIFENLSNNKWCKNKNLHLFEIVDDILNYEESDDDGSK